MSFLKTHIFSKIFYSSVGSKMLCLERNTADRLRFIFVVNELLGRMSKQESQKRDIII